MNELSDDIVKYARQMLAESAQHDRVNFAIALRRTIIEIERLREQENRAWEIIYALVVEGLREREEIFLPDIALNEKEIQRFYEIAASGLTVSLRRNE